MLTQEENDRLTRVGPGTPGGDLLRRYWWPVAPVQELTAEQPTRFVRVLGEDLVLWKDKSGNVGLMQDHCAHRGASLMYGRVEERGIACAYHGWLFNTAGDCMECPAEPAGSLFHLTVKMRAYPVQSFVGLYWAYLGPLPAPAITKYDVLARTDGTHSVEVHPQLDCNWFQAMENSVDPAHARILHANFEGRAGDGRPEPVNTTRGRTDEVLEFSFYEVACGIMKKRVSRNGHVDEHPLIFPNILRHLNDAQIRVPIDDTHTSVVFVKFKPSPDGAHVEQPEALPLRYMEPNKQPAGALHPNTRFTMHSVQPQDYMAWETQGPIADRSVERLATSDRGIVMLREMLQHEIAKVQRGEDPRCVFRDPNHDLVDTNHTTQMFDYSTAGRSREDLARLRV